MPIVQESVTVRMARRNGRHVDCFLLHENEQDDTTDSITDLCMPIFDRLWPKCQELEEWTALVDFRPADDGRFVFIHTDDGYYTVYEIAELQKWQDRPDWPAGYPYQMAYLKLFNAEDMQNLPGFKAAMDAGEHPQLDIDITPALILRRVDKNADC